MKDNLTIRGVKGEIKIRRLVNGYPHIQANEELDLYYGLGYMHASDRMVQMWLMKIIGMGRASELLMSSPDMIEADRYMRWIDLAGDAACEVDMLSPEARPLIEAYCQGVNAGVKATSLPLEFRMVGYQPDEWTVADVMLSAKMIGFVGLASTQADVEKFIFQMLQNGVDPARVKELFPYIQEEITPELIEIIKKTKSAMPIIPPSAAWKRLLPSFSASNNWVVAPQKSASGRTLLCADPHLGLQLPNIWYTAVLKGDGFYVMGASLAGAPAVAIGRSNHMGWAATYGTMDLSDFFIEDIKDGKYRRGEEWLPLTVREEVIRPKKGAPINLRICSTEHGTLEGEPKENGYHLSFALSIKKYLGSAAQSLNGFVQVIHCKTAEKGLDLFAELTFSPFNWIMGDADGNIGYQLGGLFPAKRPGTSGLLPYLGWDPADDWQGVVEPRTYPRQLNPGDGIIATANNDFNHLGQSKPMTLPMSPYRVNMIRRRLTEKEKLGPDDIQRIHYDRYSLQAELFMRVICPLLPDSPNGQILRDWNLRYTADSLGATLFENIYTELVKLVFGEIGVGAEVMDSVLKETLVFPMTHGNFDAVLLCESSAWFAGKSRQEIFTEAITRGLAAPAKRHGETRRIYIENQFLGGKLPRWLGFDFPLKHIGSRATIPQAQLYRSAGRAGSFAATFRMICDFAVEEMRLNMSGGASGNRFSPYYMAGMRDWVDGVYKVIKP
jgi:penicillin G amidase